MICELFSQIQEYLSDEENISLILCSKEIYNQKNLIKFKLSYNFNKIYNLWCLPQIKNITIDDYIESTIFEDQIKLILFDSNYRFLTADNLSIIYIMGSHMKIRLMFYLCDQIIKLCIKYGYFSFAATLSIGEQYHLTHGHKKNFFLKNNALLKAINRNCFQIVELLIDKDIYVETLNEAVIIALNNPNIDIKIIKLLIDSGARIEMSTEAVIIALNNPNIDIKIIKLLIDSGAYVDLNNIVIIPILNGNIEILQLLISYGADISHVSNRDIVEVWKNGHKDMVQFLIKNKH